jgi:hypothetical protein
VVTEPGLTAPHLAHYQLSYCEWCNKQYFTKTYQLIVKKLENKTVCCKETVECWHLIFWPVSQGRVYYHTAKLKANWRVTIDWVPLWVLHSNFQVLWHCRYNSLDGTCFWKQLKRKW